MCTLNQPEPWYFDAKYKRFWQIYSLCMFHAHKHAFTRCRESKDSTAATLYAMVSYI